MQLDIRENYAALTETLKDCAIYTLDPQGNLADWSAGAQSMHGYLAEEIVGRHVSMLYTPEDASNGVPLRTLEAAGANGRFEEENWRIRKDGSRLWTHSVTIALRDGHHGLAGFLEVSRDLTKRKRAEERFRLAVESAPNAMVMANQEGKIVLVNSQTEKLFGYTREELIGERVEILVPRPFPDTQPAVREEELVGLRKDGSEFPVEIGLNLIETEEETWVLRAIVDITERKRALESHIKQAAQIQHAQKLQSLGVLAGGIAHDFNNLLVAILGYSGLALLELPPQSRAQVSVQKIETAALRAAELTRQLLAYSGKGKFVIQPVNLSSLVREISDLLSVSISKKISLVRQLSEDHLPIIEGDAVQMQQVVMNLITNASDAIGDNTGAITVRTSAADVNREYLAKMHFDEDLAAGRYVCLEVSDTGCGIDAETRRHIFDPFFTTKFTGRGLGLAAVLGIIRGHKGAIAVHSEAGHGTTFQVLLPSSGKEIVLQMTQDSERNKTWRGSGTVLVIDDEDGVRVVARLALEKCGFTVLAAEDGPAGIEMFRQHAGEIAIVLLDMTMPHLSGAEVFEELTRIKPGVRVVLSSGFSEHDATSLFIGKGLAGFIQKPYQPLALVEKMRQTLEGRGYLEARGGAA